MTMHLTVTEEQVYERLCRMADEANEVMQFAYKKDKLELYRAAEIDYCVLKAACALVKEKLDAKKPQPPGSPG